MSIGLLTYHSAYNYGSALQAYATLCQLKKVDRSALIINYRMKEQSRFYCPTCRFDQGMKIAVKDLLQLPVQGKKVQRAQRFEKFFEQYLSVTPRIAEPEEAARQWEQFDAVVSGSDQIWNKHSCELANNEWRYMDPYLLKDFRGKKISYASSIGNMTDSELERIICDIKQFDALSFREVSSAKRMERLLGRPVATVLDPTFLLTRDEWAAQLPIPRCTNERYLFAYFLCGPKQLLWLLPVLSKLAERFGCQVRLVTPFAYLPCADKRIEYHTDYGPLEFIEALYHAEMTITDSYHGTVLSVNLEKEFYSVCYAGYAEFRKTDILGQLGLTDRVIAEEKRDEDLQNIGRSKIDYEAVRKKLEPLRQHSVGYLNAALDRMEQ